MAGGASYDDDSDPLFPQRIGEIQVGGISQRLYIATALMQGVLASGDVASDPAIVCRSVLALADALIAADKAP